MLKKAWLRILAYCRYYKQGYPLTQLRLFRKEYKKPITRYKLYRRSRVSSLREHWGQTNPLAEISTNWSKLTKKMEYVLLDGRYDKLYNPQLRRVIICDLDYVPKEEEMSSYPFCKTIKEDGEGELKIMVYHNPDDYNYAHSQIECYLTTPDGKYNNSRIPHKDYDSYPLNKELAGLKKKYKAHLLYHFAEHKDYILPLKHTA